jgi:hypothetical protein
LRKPRKSAPEGVNGSLSLDLKDPSLLESDDDPGCEIQKDGLCLTDMQNDSSKPLESPLDEELPEFIDLDRIRLNYQDHEEAAKVNDLDSNQETKQI